MADDDDMGGCIGMLIVLALIIAVIIGAIILFGSIGALFGSGVSVKNYISSFRENVRFEKPSYY